METLSDKIGDFDGEKVDNNLLWTEDVKKFIEEIRKFEWFTDRDEKWEDTVKRHNKFIDDKAGNKLISGVLAKGDESQGGKK